MTDLEQIDIKLDEEGQIIVATDGEVQLISNYDCFYQDIRNEAMTQEGDVFYAEDYGWSMLDFAQVEHDELVKIEIKQRVKEKLTTRDVISESSINAEVNYTNDGNIAVRIKFMFIDSNAEYSIDLNIDGTEVTLVD
jgi:hypothetical protein